MTGFISNLAAARSGLAALAVLLCACIQPLAEDYTLGPMDKLRVRISEWKAAEATAVDWSSVSGEYTVGPSGEISLPFVGPLTAAGMTTQQVSVEIAEALEQHLGLLSRPDATVELAEYRPIFIAGDVNAPGRYPFEPDLTVLKAVSLAGGIRQAADSSLRVERDYISASGNRRVLEAERARLAARRARLVAESTDEETIAIPASLADDPQGKALIAKEAAYMAARNESLERQLSNLEDLQELLQSEIASLGKKLTTQKRQIDISREELEGIGGLADKGLVVNERVRSIERSIAEMEGKALDMETAQLRARQDMNKAQRDMATLRDDRKSSIAQDLQETEADMEDLGLKIDMYSGLMTEAASQAPAAVLAYGGEGGTVGYRIVRKKGDEQSEIVVGENESVRPGDVIKVAVMPSATQ